MNMGRGIKIAKQILIQPETEKGHSQKHSQGKTRATIAGTLTANR